MNRCQRKAFVKVYSSLTTSLSALFPRHCRLCRQDGAGTLDLCAGCRNSLRPLTRLSACCALPPFNRSSEKTSVGSACPHCAPDNRPWQGAHALFAYVDPLRNLHRRLKFQGRLRDGELLARLLADLSSVTHGHTPPADLIDCWVPMPLHPARWRSRGFNQAELLLRHLAQKQRRKICRNTLRRVRNTAPQSSLGTELRRDNVANAFDCKRLDGETVALFDDVMTTGETLHAASASLLAAGAGAVYVCAMFRVLPRHDGQLDHHEFCAVR